MNKLKYILIIVPSVLAGMVLGWFAFSGGSVEIRLPDFNVKVDTMYKQYTDTLRLTRTKIEFDTVKALDSIFVTVRDTTYSLFDKNAVYPKYVGNNLYLTPSFEYQSEYYYKNDTIIPTFYFPNMISEVIHKHGIDSVRVEYKTIYVDYWYNNAWIQGASLVTSAILGYFLNDLGKTK